MPRLRTNLTLPDTFQIGLFNLQFGSTTNVRVTGDKGNKDTWVDHDVFDNEEAVQGWTEYFINNFVREAEHAGYASTQVSPAPLKGIYHLTTGADKKSADLFRLNYRPTDDCQIWTPKSERVIESVLRQLRQPYTLAHVQIRREIFEDLDIQSIRFTDDYTEVNYTPRGIMNLG